MVLVCGIPSEKPVAMLIKRLKKRKIPYLLLNQRKLGSTRLNYKIIDAEIIGSLTIEDKKVNLHEICGVYNRLVNYHSLPEFATKSQQFKEECKAFHEKLFEWFELTEAKVLNKNSSMTSNMSKPFQINLIKKFGLAVPETLITNNTDDVRAFYKKKQVIYKSASAERSIVKMLEKKDLERLSQICWCPTQFQEFIDGENIRVHVLGNKVFPTLIKAEGTDYRYDNNSSYEPCSLPTTIKDACIKLTNRTGMHFSGIDLKYHPEKDRYYCFEMNPSPAYSHYETHSGQKISAALATYLNT